MTKQELLELIKDLPDDLPAEVWQQIAGAVRSVDGASLVDAVTVEGVANADDWVDGTPREEEAAEPDRWLEERR